MLEAAELLEVEPLPVLRVALFPEVRVDEPVALLRVLPELWEVAVLLEEPDVEALREVLPEVLFVEEVLALEELVLILVLAVPELLTLLLTVV